jgi:hypothetical protein
VGRGSSQIRLSFEINSMVLAGDGRSWMPLCPLTGLMSAVVALPGRNLAIH